VLMGIKRVYDKREITDGRMVFVERLWPRGVKRSTQVIDLWMKEVAPSDALRKWFAHDPEKWDEFRRRYNAELEENGQVGELIAMVKRIDVTLVYSARDTEHNSAIVLAEFIRRKL
jgi:uncharacterized protein YeaO (DUF488 family)